MFEQHKQKLLDAKRAELTQVLQDFEASLTPDSMRPQMQARLSEVTNQIEDVKRAQNESMEMLRREHDEAISPLFREQEELRQALETPAVEEAPVA